MFLFTGRNNPRVTFSLQPPPPAAAVQRLSLAVLRAVDRVNQEVIQMLFSCTTSLFFFRYSSMRNCTYICLPYVASLNVTWQ